MVKQGNDYVVKVKSNQHKLYGQIQQRVNTARAQDSCLTQEKNRGRKEKRTVKIFSVPHTIRADWPHARSIVHVQRITDRQGKHSETDSYYLSSMRTSAKSMAKGIRLHWSIENQLHYVKDTVAHEDAIRIKQTNAAAVLSLCRNIAINLYRLNGYTGIKNAIRTSSGNLSQLLKFIRE